MSVLSSENIILVERTGDIVTVILNRPNKLNALNKAMWQRLAVVMNELNDDHSIRCVILRGAGDKAMGPGADISEFESVFISQNNTEGPCWLFIPHNTIW